MEFLHSSRARGRVPDALKRAAEVRYVGHRADGDEATVLRFKAAPFGSAAPELFGQDRIWDDGPTKDQTAFELFAAALVDVAAQQRESSRFGLGLLERIGTYDRVVRSRGGLRRIVLPDAQSSVPARLDADVVKAAKELAAATPESRPVRVMGRLDLLGTSQRVMKIMLDPRKIDTAVWSSDEDFAGLKKFLDKDEFFRKLPEAVIRRDYARLARLRPGEPSAYAKILGSIPAEESDEEFPNALEELS